MVSICFIDVYNNSIFIPVKQGRNLDILYEIANIYTPILRKNNFEPSPKTTRPNLSNTHFPYLIPTYISRIISNFAENTNNGHPITHTM